MPSTKVLFRIAIAALAAAPIAAVSAFFRDQAKVHPALVISLLIVWEIIVVICGFIVKVYNKLQERWVDSVAEWVDAALRRVFSHYPRQYRYFLSRMHHDVDLRGLSTWGMYTLAMDEVYVDVSLMPQAPHLIPSAPVNPDDGKAGPTLAAEVPAQTKPHDGVATNSVVADPNINRHSIWELLDRCPDAPIAVLGPPGSGKTTLLRHVALALCRRQRNQRVPNRWRRHVPVLLFLREHVATIIEQPDVTLPDIIRRTLTRLTKAEPPKWFDRQLDAGNCIVMLDGLDEVARREDRASVMKWVRQQIDQYPRNRYILTSRPFGFVDPPLISATVVQVRQFTDAQVETFVRSWYRTVEQRSANRDDIGVRVRAEDAADKLLGRLYASPALLALATNPLLLTMITSVHKYRAALPGSRAELYREICQVFLGKRQEAKELSSDLSIDQKTIVLRHLAFAMMERRIRDMPVGDACELIASILEKVSYRNPPAAFLVEIEQSTGLLTERDTGVYTFAHLTFQEYLAALHVAEVKPVGFLLANLNDSWWREVTLLRVANADATPIVEAVLHADPPTVEMLSLAAECVDQAREVSSAARRQLSDMISWRAWEDDPIRRRLVAQVLLARKLQHVVRSSHGVFICAEPLLNAEYKCFLTDLGSDAGAFYSSSVGVTDVDTDTLPVVGIGPQAAIRFTEWVQSLGLDLQVPSSSQLSVSDLHRAVKPPVPGFWSRIDTPEQGGHLILSAPLPFPFAVPNFESLVREQLAADARILGKAFPAEKRNLVAMSPANGLIDVDEYHSLLANLISEQPANRAHSSSSDFGEYELRAKHLATALADHLLAVMEKGVSIPNSFDDLPADPTVTLYGSIVPRLIPSFIQCLAAGRHWAISHLHSLDERYSVAFGYTNYSFMHEMDMRASDMTIEAQVIRAYMRMVCWSFVAENRSSGYGLFRFLSWRHWRRFWGTRLVTSETWHGVGAGMRKYSFSETWSNELITLNLIEWRIRDRLPAFEGMIFVRA